MRYGRAGWACIFALLAATVGLAAEGPAFSAPEVVALATVRVEASVSTTYITSVDLDRRRLEMEDHLRQQAGSGFFCGPDGYLVTCWHVIGLSKKALCDVGLSRLADRAPISPTGLMPLLRDLPRRSPEEATRLAQSGGRFEPLLRHAEAALNVFVTLPDGRTKAYPAEPVAVDETLDLALLRVVGLTKPPTPLPLVEIEPADGDEVIAVGHPRGPLEKSAGTVYRVLRGDCRRPGDRQVDMDAVDASGAICSILYWSDAAEGHSGGPLLGPSGGVIGVTHAAVENPPVGKPPQHLNAAVPAKRVRQFLARCERVGESPKRARERGGGEE